MYNKKMDFDEFLTNSNIEKTVLQILTEIHPVLMDAAEESKASPWEIVTCLMVLLAGITAGTKLDKEMVMSMLSVLIDQTMKNEMFLGDIGKTPGSFIKH
tara:strand:- start:979 stop:1278 length:300 start_codon:yes stop_codon:yes gene_type:complete